MTITFDFSSFRPTVFYIGTLTYQGERRDPSGRKIKEIIDFMPSKGYFTYVDTDTNTIFVDKAAWVSLK